VCSSDLGTPGGGGREDCAGQPLIGRPLAVTYRALQALALQKSHPRCTRTLATHQQPPFGRRAAIRAPAVCVGCSELLKPRAEAPERPRCCTIQLAGRSCSGRSQFEWLGIDCSQLLGEQTSWPIAPCWVCCGDGGGGGTRAQLVSGAPARVELALCTCRHSLKQPEAAVFSLCSARLG